RATEHAHPVFFTLLQAGTIISAVGIHAQRRQAATGVGTCGIKANFLGSGASFHSFCWHARIAVSKRIISTLFYTQGSGDATCPQFFSTQLESGPLSPRKGSYFPRGLPLGKLWGLIKFTG